MTTFGVVYLPERAMSVLDSWYDLDYEKEKANYEAGIEEEEDFKKSGEHGYTECDRPEISEVKKMQKQKGNPVEKYLPILNYEQQARFVASKPKVAPILKQILDIAVSEFTRINTDSYSEEFSNQWFNIVITTCVNMDVTPFKKSLQ